MIVNIKKKLWIVEIGNHHLGDNYNNNDNNNNINNLYTGEKPINEIK